MAESFVCPVCKSRKPLQAKKGPNYIEQPNKDRICNSCIDADTVKDMQVKGKITLELARDKDAWYAVNRTGNLRFRLERQEGQTESQMIGTPTFRDKEGKTWRGRFYPVSGSAHFQATGQPAPAHAGDGKPQAKRDNPRARKGKKARKAAAGV